MVLTYHRGPGSMGTDVTKRVLKGKNYCGYMGTVNHYHSELTNRRSKMQKKITF